jgi:uncharacterized membrane protein YfcA
MIEERWWLFFASAFAAEVVGTMAGFGAATILTPIAAFFMDIKTAIAVVTCFHLFGNASRLVFFGRFVRWRLWWQFGMPGILWSVLGAMVTTRLSSSVVQLLFGLFLIVYVLSELVGTARWVLPMRASTLIAGGAVSGLIAGVLGTGGAVRSACLMAFQLPKEVYLGTSAMLALCVDATRLPVYLIDRLIPSAMASIVLGLMGVAFAGAWLGQRLVRHLDARAFRRLVLVVLALMGGYLLWEGRHALA